MKPASTSLFLHGLFGAFCGCIAATLFWSKFIMHPLYANIAQCRANTISPSYILPSSSNTFDVNVENNGPDNAVWIQITRSSANFTFTDGSLDGWDADVTPNTITFTGGSIEGGTEVTLSVSITSGSSETSAETFSLAMNSEEGDSNATECPSTATLEVTNNPPIELEISNLHVSNVTNNSVTINFNTTIDSTAIVDYYTSGSGDGLQAESNTPTTNHSISIPNLTTNTTYFYSIFVTDGNDHNLEISDATFTTALSALATSTPGPTSEPIIRTTTLPTPTPIPDTKKPVLTIQTLTSTPYKEVPTITGSVTDNSDVASVEYSIDQGKTWTQIKTITGLNSNVAQFSVKPVGLTHGSHIISFRAKDRAGNSGLGSTTPIIIDLEGPIITLQTNFSQPYTTPPVIHGTAVDPALIRSIEYAIGSATNWTLVDTVSEEGAASRFSFTLPRLDDDNYPIFVRATDTLGNISSPQNNTLIIDRLPPRVGGFFFHLGPEILRSTTRYLQTLIGLPTTITVSVIGGPTEVTIQTTPGTSNTLSNDQQNNKKDIKLRHIPNTTLWTGDIIFDSPDLYSLQITARDGANNLLNQTITTLSVVSPITINTSNNTLLSGNVTLYIKTPGATTFTPWDAEPYGQINPQKITDQGFVVYYPPAGTYYLEIKPSQGFGSVITDVFTLNEAQPLSFTLTMPENPTLSLLGQKIPWFRLFRPVVPITLDASLQNQTQTSEQINVSKWIQTHLNDSFFTSFDPNREYRNTPFTLIYLNTWGPDTAAQLYILENMFKQDQTRSIVAIFPHESATTVELFKKRGNYNIPMYADPDGDLLEILPYAGIPTMYTINEEQNVTEQYIGIQKEVQ